MIQKFTVDVEVPNGYEVTDYNLPKVGDKYLYNGNVSTCYVAWEYYTDKQFIVRGKVTLRDLKPGEKFNLYDRLYTFVNIRNFIVNDGFDDLKFIAIDESYELCGFIIDHEIKRA